MQVQRVTRWGKSVEPPAVEGTVKQINYLNNSNNVHTVFGTRPENEVDRNPNSFVHAPRSHESSNSRSRRRKLAPMY